MAFVVAGTAAWGRRAANTHVAATTTATRDPARTYHGTVTILENASHGPQACFSMATSLPPQCGGPDLRNFSWSDVHAQTLHGVTWGEAEIVGTFRENTITLTDRPTAPVHRVATTDPGVAPCPTPSGGWRPSDATKLSEHDLEEASARARAEPDFAGAWVDQSMNPTPDNDPAKVVFVVTFTGDIARHTAEIRAVWGGALCVVARPHTMAELERARDRLFTPEAKAAGVEIAAGAGLDDVHNAVEADVIIADDQAQQWVDTTFGSGVVILKGALQPVP